MARTDKQIAEKLKQEQLTKPHLFIWRHNLDGTKTPVKRIRFHPNDSHKHYLTLRRR